MSRRRAARLAARLAAGLGLAGVIVACAAGCGSHPSFSADHRTRVEADLPPTAAGLVEAVLRHRFGTPDEPRVPATLAGVVDAAKVADAAGPVESHTEGVTTGLYRRHCSRCHGLTGNGRGAAALYQAPYPRDFRTGVFKFKSTERGAPPTDADLHATLTRGLAGAAMPSFRLLKDDELAALVDYTKYLAIRGEVESRLLGELADTEPADLPAAHDPAGAGAPDADPLDHQTRGEIAWLASLADELVGQVADRWRAASNRVVDLPAPPSTLDHAALVAEGEALFHDEKLAGCVKCHGQHGRGSGVQQELDLWNTRRRDFLARRDAIAASLATIAERLAGAAGPTREQLANRFARVEHELADRTRVADEMLPPRPTRARRLAGGMLRSGGRSADLFRVIHEGIAGTPMPAAGAALSDRQIWSLVAYVESITAPSGESTLTGRQP